jgi:hypothetical protein
LHFLARLQHWRKPTGVVEGALAAATGSQAEAATRTRDEPIQAALADTLAEGPTGIVMPAGATVAVATMAAAAITVEEVITAVAAMDTDPALASASDSTARRTLMDTATRPAIAARPATMISTVIGFLRGAPRILIECWQVRIVSGQTPVKP